jgi:hypothetical protein
MNPQWQIWQVWVPPALALFGSLIVVVITAWLNTKSVISMISAQGIGNGDEGGCR